MISPLEIWKSFSLSEDEMLSWNVGPIRIHAKRINKDWLVAHEPNPDRKLVDISSGLNAFSDDIESQRVAFKTARKSVRFEPATPDRPLVVRPDAPLGIPPESEVQFFINIPAFVKVFIGEGKSALELPSIPSEILSNTWFGDTFSGVFCYASKSHIRREKMELDVHPSQIICPFKIKNKGDELLNVERICLRSEYLSIYSGEQRLWSNEVTAIFRGHGKNTQLEFSNSAPKDAINPMILVKSKLKPERGFLRQTFVHNAFPWRKGHS